MRRVSRGFLLLNFLTIFSICLLMQARAMDSFDGEYPLKIEKRHISFKKILTENELNGNFKARKAFSKAAKYANSCKDYDLEFQLLMKVLCCHTIKSDPEGVVESFKNIVNNCYARADNSDADKALSVYVSALELLECAQRYMEETGNPKSIYYSRPWSFSEKNEIQKEIHKVKDKMLQRHERKVNNLMKLLSPLP